MIDSFFWWLGFAMSAVGGLVVLVGFSWWAFEFICRQLGWTKIIIEVYRRILRERRTTKPAR
jgi:hypothetical protein